MGKGQNGNSQNEANVSQNLTGNDSTANGVVLKDFDTPPLRQSTKKGSYTMLSATLTYYRALWYFARGHDYADCTYFGDDLQAKVHVYSIFLIFKMWDMAHYRNGTYQEDMVKNLRNVAIPGTGIPLSVFCYFKFTCLIFVVIVYPIIAYVAARHANSSGGQDLSKQYVEQLLMPQDWFSFWRLNCSLASYHAALTGAEGYEMEDKWKFLVTGEQVGVPVSPFMKTSGIVVKDKNEEGGMGIHFFKNAARGGDWIVQDVLENSDELKAILPHDAPLSTFRVITASRGGNIDHDTASDKPTIKSLSCVFRAGLAGASTDHTSMLFDVDTQTGEIKRGTTNNHWYVLGPKGLKTKWTSSHDVVDHPDTGVRVTGTRIPNMAVYLKLVEDAHMAMMPDVPLAGWDLALTNKGVCLLEANLSCNFFRGSFDQKAYFEFVDEYFVFLDKLDVKDRAKTKQMIRHSSEIRKAEASPKASQ